jgi:hypothetical protein
LIVDEGFHDARPTTKYFDYKSVMPFFLNKREKLTTEEANDTRLVTKVR